MPNPDTTKKLEPSTGDSGQAPAVPKQAVGKKIEPTSQSSVQSAKPVSAKPASDVNVNPQEEQDSLPVKLESQIQEALQVRRRLLTALGHSNIEQKLKDTEETLRQYIKTKKLPHGGRANNILQKNYDDNINRFKQFIARDLKKLDKITTKASPKTIDVEKKLAKNLINEQQLIEMEQKSLPKSPVPNITAAFAKNISNKSLKDLREQVAKLKQQAHLEEKLRAQRAEKARNEAKRIKQQRDQEKNELLAQIESLKEYIKELQQPIDISVPEDEVAKPII